MFIDRGEYSWYEKCLQCAYQQDLKELAEFKKQAARRETEPVRVGQSRPKKWFVLSADKIEEIEEKVAPTAQVAYNSTNGEPFYSISLQTPPGIVAG